MRKKYLRRYRKMRRYVKIKRARFRRRRIGRRSVRRAYRSLSRPMRKQSRRRRGKKAFKIFGLGIMPILGILAAVWYFFIHKKQTAE